jgi:hypothetical protein
VPDGEGIAAFIERIVAAARLPTRTARDDLRRELSSHFDEAAASPEAFERALRCFGDARVVSDSLRHVYRGAYVFRYLLKVAASTLVSLAAVLLIQLIANLRIESRADAWRLAPGFPYAAGLSVGVVLALVTGWEISRAPFNRVRAAAAVVAYATICVATQRVFAQSGGAIGMAMLLVGLGYACSGRQPRPARLLLMFAAFAAAEYTVHLMRSVAFGADRAVQAGAALIAVWSATVLILTRVDRAFFDASDHLSRSDAG